jgi:hypothetical protein
MKKRIDIFLLTFLVEASPKVNRMFSKRSVEKLDGFSVACEGKFNIFGGGMTGTKKDVFVKKLWLLRSLQRKITDYTFSFQFQEGLFLNLVQWYSATKDQFLVLE